MNQINDFPGNVSVAVYINVNVVLLKYLFKSIYLKKNSDF